MIELSTIVGFFINILKSLLLLNISSCPYNHDVRLIFPLFVFFLDSYGNGVNPLFLYETGKAANRWKSLFHVAQVLAGIPYAGKKFAHSVFRLRCVAWYALLGVEVAFRVGVKSNSEGGNHASWCRSGTTNHTRIMPRFSNLYPSISKMVPPFSNLSCLILTQPLLPTGQYVGRDCKTKLHYITTQLLLTTVWHVSENCIAKLHYIIAQPFMLTVWHDTKNSVTKLHYIIIIAQLFLLTVWHDTKDSVTKLHYIIIITQPFLLLGMSDHIAFGR